MKSLLPLASFVLLLAACQSEAPNQDEAHGMESLLPPLETASDSLAFRALEASGGEMAVRSMPYLRFNFGVPPRPPRKHMWDKMTGDYRLEYDRGDTTFVVLFNTETREGAAFADGVPVSDSPQRVESAYSAFINDTYWLMMPVKMLDHGVYREVVPDSSTAQHAVVRIWFDQVGLTPGDTYYVWINRDTGMVDRWHYVLQSGNENDCLWSDYRELSSPLGAVRLSETKNCGSFMMKTDGLAAPESVPEGMFSDSAPML